MELVKYKKRDLATGIILIIVIIWLTIPRHHKPYDFEPIISDMRVKALDGNLSHLYPIFSYYIDNKKYKECRKFYNDLVKRGFKEDAHEPLEKIILERKLTINICTGNEDNGSSISP